MTTALPRNHVSRDPHEQPFKSSNNHVVHLLRVERFRFASIQVCAMRQLHGSGEVTQEGVDLKAGRSAICVDNAGGKVTIFLIPN